MQFLGLQTSVATQHFPILVARVNAALNVIHVATAFALQSSIGVVIQQWSSSDGHFPQAAYQMALALGVAMQIAALGWFMRPERDAGRSASPRRVMHPPHLQVGALLEVDTLELEVGPRWDDRLAFARASVRKWRLTAVGSALVSVTLGAVVISNAGGASVAP